MGRGLQHFKIFHAVVLACGLALFFVFSSCVKEDRSGCPFWLTVDMQKSSRSLSTKDFVEVSVFDRAGMKEGRIEFSDTLKGLDHYPVRRGDFTVVTVFGRDGGRFSYDRRKITFGEGSEADSLWTSRIDSTWTDEVLTVYPVLHKQWCRVTFVGEWEDEDGYTLSETVALEHPAARNFFDVYHIVVRGVAAGFDLTTLEGEAGAFRYLPPVQVDSTTVNLPRQGGEGLEVDFINNATGLCEHTMSLTSALRAVGYDWTEDDLRDVRLTLSMVADCLYEIRIREWDHIEMGDISI